MKSSLRFRWLEPWPMISGLKWRFVEFGRWFWNSYSLSDNWPCPLRCKIKRWHIPSTHQGYFEFLVYQWHLLCEQNVMGWLLGNGPRSLMVGAPGRVHPALCMLLSPCFWSRRSRSRSRRRSHSKSRSRRRSKSPRRRRSHSRERGRRSRSTSKNRWVG